MAKDNQNYQKPEVVKVSGVIQTERSVRLNFLVLKDGTRIQPGWARLLASPPPPETELVDADAEVVVDRAAGTATLTKPLTLKGGTEVVLGWARLVRG